MLIHSKITVQVRPLQLGTPTENYSDSCRSCFRTISDSNSTDASVATKVKFPSPVYLEPEQEYAIVLLAPTSNLYEVWVLVWVKEL